MSRDEPDVAVNISSVGVLIEVELLPPCLFACVYADGGVV